MNSGIIKYSATAHEREARAIGQACLFRPEGAFVAGGALTSVFTGAPINDVDVYFKSAHAFREAVRDAYEEGLWCVAATDRAVTFVQGDDVMQLMHFEFFPEAEDVFDAFDFTVCMAALELDTNTFTMHGDFLKHASQRYLLFNSSTRFPFGSLLRTIKYRERGYKLGKGDLLRIALRCHQVPLTSWDELRKAIGGHYGERVCLDDSKPFSLDVAIETIATGDFTVRAEQQDMPGNADDLLALLGY